LSTVESPIETFLLYREGASPPPPSPPPATTGAREEIPAWVILATLIAGAFIIARTARRGRQRGG